MSVTSAIDPLNGLNLKKDALGQREWSYNIFDCFATPGLCLMAHCLPCVAHGQSEQKATSMATTGQGTSPPPPSFPLTTIDATYRMNKR